MKKEIFVVLATMIMSTSPSISEIKQIVSSDDFNAYAYYEEIIPAPEVEEIIVKKNQFYLPITGEAKLEYELKLSEEFEPEISLISDDESICTIDENGMIKGLANGSTLVRVLADDKEAFAHVLVTDLILPVPDEPDILKEVIGKKDYTKEENDLLDQILEDRINDAGYGTRAGVVATARFMGLEFPYKLPYFSENGRVTTFGIRTFVDGEGRYYHKGLYLDESRYEGIEKSLYGPGVWGKNIYCVPSGYKRENGFDCSGFITWILLNGGFDCGDIGAGITSVTDMTDLGEKKLLKTSMDNGEIKAGDLLSGKGSGGGHIALVTGMKDGKYYVAESLWRSTGCFGAIITTRDYDDMLKNFYWHIDMDDYYGEDGNYTEYWK